METVAQLCPGVQEDSDAAVVPAIDNAALLRDDGCADVAAIVTPTSASDAVCVLPSGCAWHASVCWDFGACEQSCNSRLGVCLSRSALAGHPSVLVLCWVTISTLWVKRCGTPCTVGTVAALQFDASSCR